MMKRCIGLWMVFSIGLLLSPKFLQTIDCFSVTFISSKTQTRGLSKIWKEYKVKPLDMSFVADGSDYSSSDSDYEDSSSSTDDDTAGPGFNPMAMDAPTIEEEPVPLSKNAGSRFIAFIWDNIVDQLGRSAMELHDSRVDVTTDHIMHCRKTNLYNETFNYNSNADIVWSYPLLSSDLRRYIGHAICIDSNTLESAKEFLMNDPMIQSLAGTEDVANTLSRISLFRWRHLKDYSLRQDDGRFGLPTLIVGLHAPPTQNQNEKPSEEWLNMRNEAYDEHLQYLIESERIIQAGPLHIGTPNKNDPESLPIGDLLIINAKDRADAVEFAENDPLAKCGLYQTLKVHRYNDLDVTGKFVAENQDLKLTDGNDLHLEMKEALEYWGYPVHDTQTKWLNR